MLPVELPYDKLIQALLRGESNVLTQEERFWLRVRVDDVCWIWQGTVLAQGYGIFYLGKRQVRAHRLAYEWLVGPIPLDHDLHHTCARRLCVNPAHLEPRRPADHGHIGHNALKTHCKYGHEFTQLNIYRVKTKWGTGRHCQACKWLRKRRRPLTTSLSDTPFG